MQTAQAYQKTAVLRAAIDLDLFTAIDQGAHTAVAIAQRCGAAERGVRMLADVLTVMRFLSKTDDTYALTRDTATFLLPSSPAYLGGLMEFVASPEMMSTFGRLTDTVRRGAATGDSNATAPDHPVWQKFARAMAPLMKDAAEQIADLLQIASAGPVRVLDIAAGHGLFGIALARRNPQAAITAVDWQAVLEVACENARKNGVAERYRTLPGSAFSVEFGTGYDIALLTNFLHHFDTDTCTGFLRKVRTALAPGGRVVVLEFVPNDDRVSPPGPAGFALNMLAATPAGNAYTLREHRAMLEAAGFRGITAQPASVGPETILIAAA
jgi:SAM-dependent methyltransferase